MTSTLSIPDKTVVLTFDDTVRSHLTVVAPLLREYGFGATFFITGAWMKDTENFLSWEEVAELHRLGFEIGNHTMKHAALHEPEKPAHAEKEIADLEEALKKAGVPKPVSFGWPGNHFGPETLAILRERGYLFARRGPVPDAPPSDTAGLGPLYDPEKHDPLLLPSAGMAVPEWTLEDFKKIVDRAKDGRVAVLGFHGVPDGAHPFCSTPPERFREFMAYLKKGGFNVIALQDLQRYFTPEPVPDDPMTKRRFFR